MKAYSLDLRQKVLAATLRGDRTIREVAESFGVGTTFVDKVLALHRAGSVLAPRPHGGGYPTCLLPRHERMLRAEVRRREDATLEELRGLVATLAVEGAVDTLCFDAYAERVLGPRLRSGDVVVLDNLTAHRASRIEEVAESCGAQVLCRE